MKKDDIRYQTYVNILKEELIPAFYRAHRPGLCCGQSPPDTWRASGPGPAPGERQHY